MVWAALYGEIRSVKVGPSEVVLQYFLWARRIPYTEIAGVDLDDVGQYEWSVRRVPRVIIMTHRGEEIRLPTFPGGLLRLFNSLAAAWEQGKAMAEGPPGQAR